MVLRQARSQSVSANRGAATNRRMLDLIMGLLYRCGILKSALEWRNCQTHGTQNPAPFTWHVGSAPTSSTMSCAACAKLETGVLLGADVTHHLLAFGPHDLPVGWVRLL